MKNISLLLFFILISCGKSTEDNCFQNKDEKIFDGYVEAEPFTVKEILKNKPEYLTISDLKNFRSFKEDSISVHNFGAFNEEKYKSEIARYKAEYQDFDKVFFEQFRYSFKQNVKGIDYALGKNGLGFWLLEINNGKGKAYFFRIKF